VGGFGLPLRLRVGRKGYIILPKAIRETVGVDEGDEVVVEVRGDSIVLRPIRRSVDVGELRGFLRRHVELLRGVRGRVELRLGELASVSLEEEFEG